MSIVTYKSQPRKPNQTPNRATCRGDCIRHFFRLRLGETQQFFRSAGDFVALGADLFARDGPTMVAGRAQHELRWCGLIQTTIRLGVIGSLGQMCGDGIFEGCRLRPLVMYPHSMLCAILPRDE